MDIFSEIAYNKNVKKVEKVKKIMIQEKDRGALIILACHDAESLTSLSDVIYNVVEGKIKV